MSAGAALGAVGASVFGHSAGPNPRRPNVVYILADDLGFGDIRFLNPVRGKIRTPIVDRLATQGMTFSEAHSGSAVCSPTRYGVLTGRYAWRTRLQTYVLEPYDSPLIPPERVTVASLLRSLGYATACVGKWHLGMNWPRENGRVVFDRPFTGGPTAVGFDSYFGVDCPDYPPYCFINNDRTVGIPSIPKPQEIFGFHGIWLPGWRVNRILPELVRKSIQFIEQATRAGRPFFLYLPLISPHEPLAVAEEWKGKSGLGLYGDWVMQTDGAVGEVLGALDRLGQTDRTIVIFTADNGCSPHWGVDYAVRHSMKVSIHELEAQGHYPSGWFRGYKADIWEGGHHIPFVCRWPEVVKPDTRSDQVICLTDLMATVAEITGTTIPANAGEDSVSILPALKQQVVKPLREATVHHSISGMFAIRKERWKLEFCPGSGGWSEPTDAHAVTQGLPPVQLYDMHADPGERHNLQKDHPDEVQQLTELLESYVREGRSTLGPQQRNDVEVDIRKPVNSSAVGIDDVIYG